MLQRAAGPTRGVHVMPRIGQEVLVGFLHGQMDQPIVLASTYNGRGEGSRLAHEDRSNAAPVATPFDKAVDARIAGQSKVPHATNPLLMVAGRGGIGLTATELQFAVGHTHTEIAGAHHYTGVAGQTRILTGQGIGMLGGAIQANDGIGLQLIAGNGDVLVQAQSDTLTVASQKDMTISAGQPIDFAAAKKIVIKTAAGAKTEIGSSGINVTAPGSFTVHAASHQFVSGGGP